MVDRAARPRYDVVGLVVGEAYFGDNFTALVDTKLVGKAQGGHDDPWDLENGARGKRELPHVSDFIL
jgi:hypothetical protein